MLNMQTKESVELRSRQGHRAAHSTMDKGKMDHGNMEHGKT